MTIDPPAASFADAGIPLVVDLDGTLVRSNLLVESAFAWVGAKPLRLFALPGLLARGKAALKAGIAAETPLDETRQPYDEDVLALIEEARRQGRTIHIASASNRRYVAAIAAQVAAGDTRIFGVYSAYESDANGAFDVTAGVVVTDGEGSIPIEAGNYLVFNGQGEMPQMVISTWQRIWQYFEAHPNVARSYRSDFEAYEGPDKVAIHIGVA